MGDAQLRIMRMATASSNGCKYNFKTSNGESHAVDHLLRHPPPENRLPIGDPHEVWMWWHSSVFEEVVQGAQSPTAFYKLVTEVNVDFIVRDDYYGHRLIEKCGICLLYGKEVEKMIKQRAL
ncbi:putative disease resistance protein RPP1 [Prunus yedoensis var. nudiflora]|uniref:Putative disease resistance protein RPP1 n=1 Tax=Prunus yedoensis var. nudiflora TaxID=2094558 RepID=A0A314Z2Y1_PRUYE|nr:putative disease resistance protein RPP1 [Prunus yedoensis var. nudiflora]